VTPTVDERGVEVIPRRTLSYDTLVIAIGSVANTFGVPGVEEHALRAGVCCRSRPLPPAPDQRLHSGQLSARQRRAQLRVVIVGAGATGVELAAELHNSTRVLAGYGLQNIDPERFLHITLLNADPRILPMLPERIAKAVTVALEDLGVRVACSEQAIEITAGEVKTQSGKSYPRTLRSGRRESKGQISSGISTGSKPTTSTSSSSSRTLQTTRDQDIFALGDCSAFPRKGKQRPVPPAAQAAHQEASHLSGRWRCVCAGGRSRPSATATSVLSCRSANNSTIGSLMGFLSGRSYRVEGWFARLMYLSLYKMHLYALHGPIGVALDTLARLLKRGTEPSVKLH